MFSLVFLLGFLLAQLLLMRWDAAQDSLLLVPWVSKSKLLMFTTQPALILPDGLASWSKGFGHALLSEMEVSGAFPCAV
jgi:hypothetical protein